MTFLLDTNALIALGWENHEHHDILVRWLRTINAFATCPFTQGGFIRISSNPAIGFANEPTDAFRSLDSILTDHRHEFWPDDVSFGGAEIRRQLIRSHNQVTDKYLVALAHHHRGSLATLDVPLFQAFTGESGLVTHLK